MATVFKTRRINCHHEHAWAAIRDFGAVSTRLCPNFTAHTELVEGARIVTFASGMKIKERFVSSDDTALRLCYSNESERILHHNASFQILKQKDNTCIVQWNADFLPHGLENTFSSMMDEGIDDLKATLEKSYLAETN